MILAKVGGHFARLGGVIIAPRSTFSKMIEHREGTLWELFPWIVVVVAAVAPVRMGRAFLLMRVSVLDGFTTFLNVLSSRMTQALLGLLVAAVLLHLLGRVKDAQGDGVRFDQALDLCAFTLVPYLLLASLGATLSNLGIELWFMPHRSIRGGPLTVTIKCLVAFGWSLILFVLLVLETRRSR